MAAAQFSCSTFTDRGTAYFSAVTLHGAQDGAEGSADLAVTDGAAAWTAQGAPPLLCAVHESRLGVWRSCSLNCRSKASRPPALQA